MSRRAPHPPATDAATKPVPRWLLRSVSCLLSAAMVLLGVALAGVASPADAAPPTGPAQTRGTWALRDLGEGRWSVSWTSPFRLPVGSDRPRIIGPAGLDVGTPTVAADGHTVRAVVTTPGTPRPADLAVNLSGRRLDRSDESAANWRTLRAAPSAPATTELPTDPGEPGPYPVVSSDYSRTPVQVGGMRQPIEMVGHVVEPAADADTGPRPLVVLLHGRHEYCYRVGAGQPNNDWPCRGPMAELPSHLGYDYVQRLLASQGYTTVSVRVNGINAQDYALEDGGASARATIVSRHLDYWATIATQHRVDLGRVVLVGHSRGGEGVDRASIRIPLDAPYRVVGQVLVAPTDFGTQTAPYVPTVTLLPYCDGDVSDLQGQRFTDSARDLTSDDTSLKSSVLVMGANHNFFNTEWTPGLSAAPSDDDWYGRPEDPCGRETASRLTAAEQQAVGKAYIAGAVQQFTGAAGATQPSLPLFDGSAVSVPSAGAAVVLSHALGGGRDVRRPGRDTSLALPDRAVSRFCIGSTSYDYRADLCGSALADLTTPHWPWAEESVPTRSFWELGWSARGQSAGLLLDRPLDLGSRTLDLRTIVDPALGDVAVRVRLTDAEGATATLTPVGGRTLRALLDAPRVTKLWAQDLRLDATTAGGSIDLARVVRLDVVGESTDGRLWIADAAAVPQRAPAAQPLRVPTVSLGSARVAEGDGSGTTVTGVPFRISPPLTAPGELVVVTAGEEEGSRQRFFVDLAVGQTSGTIPVGYRADDLDDPATSTFSVAAWPTRNVMTDRYLGGLVVLDDDPTPKASLHRTRGTVTEGTSVSWKVTLAKAVDYDTYVSGRVVAGPGRDLTGKDVPSSWLKVHASKRGSAPTLAKLGVRLWGIVPAGARTVTLSVPVRKDGTKEGPEAVTLRAHALRSTAVSTVRVAAS